MVGTLANAGMIAAGGCAGLLLKKGIPERVQDAIHIATGLAVMVIGINGVITNMVSVDLETGKLSSSGELILVFSMILGAVIGELIGIEEHLNQLGDYVENKLHLSGFAQGFVTATLIYCVGAMAIVGSLNDGLLGDPSTLITKGVLDGITSIVLGASMGPGVIFSAIPIILYQGAITLCAGILSPILQGELLNQVCAAGYLMVASIGVNFMSDKFHIKVANLLPGLLIPVAWMGIKALAAMAGLGI